MRVGIVGPGNVGTDLLEKLRRSAALERGTSTPLCGGSAPAQAIVRQRRSSPSATSSDGRRAWTS